MPEFFHNIASLESNVRLSTIHRWNSRISTSSEPWQVWASLASATSSSKSFRSSGLQTVLGGISQSLLEIFRRRIPMLSRKYFDDAALKKIDQLQDMFPSLFQGVLWLEDSAVENKLRQKMCSFRESNLRPRQQRRWEEGIAAGTTTLRISNATMKQSSSRRLSTHRFRKLYYTEPHQYCSKGGNE